MKVKSESTVFLLLRLLIIILLAFSIIEGLIHASGFGKADYVDLKEISAYVTPNGQKETISVSKSDLPPLNQGDQLDFYIKLPKQALNQLQMNKLCFWQYHSLIRIYGSDGSLIYSYGDREYKRGDMLGDEYISATIPRYCFGSMIHIEVKQVQAFSSSHITKFRLMNAGEDHLYPLLGNRLNFALYGSLLLVSVFAISISLVRMIGVNQDRKGSLVTMNLSLFLLAMSIWQLSSRRMFYVMIQNQKICAQTEYFAILLMPIPLFLLLAEISTGKLVGVYRLLAAFFVADAMINLILHFKFNNLIVNRENYEYFFLAISCVITILGELILGSKSKDMQVQIYRQTIFFSILILFFSLSVIMFRDLFPRSTLFITLQNIDFASMAAYTFLAGMAMSLFLRFVHYTSQKARDEQTEFLAYHDLLAGIYNRTYCEEMMDDFEREPDRAYGLIFFDVDHLKEANDQFGHKVGDQLIRTAAMNIAKAVPVERGFACRWGGDEFLMVLSDPNEIEKAEENLAKEIQEVNDKMVFNFPYSISYGHAIHYSNSSKGFAELRALADRRMYEMKKKTHAQRM